MTNISKKRFENYLKVQKSGKINMFGYDFDIQHNYSNCFKHFITEKQEEDFSFKSFQEYLSENYSDIPALSIDLKKAKTDWIKSLGGQ